MAINFKSPWCFIAIVLMIVLNQFPLEGFQRFSRLMSFLFYYSTIVVQLKRPHDLNQLAAVLANEMSYLMNSVNGMKYAMLFSVWYTIGICREEFVSLSVDSWDALITSPSTVNFTVKLRSFLHNKY